MKNDSAMRLATVAVALCCSLPLRGAATEPTANTPLPSFAEIVKDVIPAVVNISTTQTVKRPEIPSGPSGDLMEEFMRRFFDQMPRSYKKRSLGSGVIISPDGEILTNAHVVGDAEDVVEVTLENQKRFKAKIVGKDKKTDVALIRIQTDHPLPAAKLAFGDDLRVGDWVIAIGNPFGLGETVTAGIVSAKGRAIGAGPYDDFIQTDASINPGNSGGPLLNVRGEVVGINSAIYSRSGGNIGIGFAIPIEMAAHIADSLRTRGKVVRGWLGVAIQDVTPEISKAMGIKETGALVADVVENGPADKAGMKRGDVILTYEGEEIGSSRDLPIRVADTPVGTRVELRILREGQEKTITAEIGELKDKEVAAEAASPASRLGLHVDSITPAIAERLGIPPHTKGVVVTAVDPGSPADNADLRPGDVVREVDRDSISSSEDFDKAITDRKHDKPVLLLVQRGESTLFVTVTPDTADGDTNEPR